MLVLDFDVELVEVVEVDVVVATAADDVAGVDEELGLAAALADVLEPAAADELLPEPEAELLPPALAGRPVPPT